MLKMRKLDHLFEEMMLFTNRNLCIIYTATIKQSKIGQKSDVTTVAMATMTIQDGRYFGFERIYFKKRSVTPIFYFRKHFLIVQCTI
jgi:hypothetical protein